MDLYWKLVRAGYVDKGRSYDTVLEVPQGSIISPLLSNIYLNGINGVSPSEFLGPPEFPKC